MELMLTAEIGMETLVGNSTVAPGSQAKRGLRTLCGLSLLCALGMLCRGRLLLALRFLSLGLRLLPLRCGSCLLLLLRFLPALGLLLLLLLLLLRLLSCGTAFLPLLLILLLGLLLWWLILLSPGLRLLDLSLRLGRSRRFGLLLLFRFCCLSRLFLLRRRLLLFILACASRRCKPDKQEQYRGTDNGSWFHISPPKRCPHSALEFTDKFLGFVHSVLIKRRADQDLAFTHAHVFTDALLQKEAR
ncbi:MAG TPA: hypothetical protein VN862_01060 [Candidatus Acidoferrales bacterium]|nr:hypothetical protein [Candidatus Acidoferrales bacterium]